MPYQFVAGYNNAGTLATLTIQPKSPGLQPGRMRRAGDGLMYADGRRQTTWNFEPSLTESDLNTVLTQVGLDADDFDASSIKATIRTTVNSARTFSNFNAIVSLPPRFRYDLRTWWDDFYLDIVIVGTPT